MRTAPDLRQGRGFGVKTINNMKNILNRLNSIAERLDNLQKDISATEENRQELLTNWRFLGESSISGTIENGKFVIKNNQ